MSSVILIAIVASLWQTAATVKTARVNNLERMGKIPYGPIPNHENDFYDFTGVHAAFDSTLEVKRIDEFTKLEFERTILSSVDPAARENLKKYLSKTLIFSQDYQMDPFWILSIMMAESRFKKTAQSPKNARGLMQIKPDTAVHLYQLMKKSVVSEEQIERNLHHPDENIEMGVFYLKKLLQNFRLNYQLATIAYNLGPNKLKSRLGYDDIDIVNYSYLVKVQEHYNELSKSFAEALRKKPRPFEHTYVVKGQGRKLEDQILHLFVVAEQSNQVSFSLSSENLKHFFSKTITN